MLQVYRFNTMQWFLTQNEVLKKKRKSTSRLLLVMKSIKCTISRIYFFKKVLRFYQSLIKKFQGFQVISRASKIFQGFPGSPGPVRTLQHFFWFHANGRNMLGPTVLHLFGWAFRFCSYISILS